MAADGGGGALRTLFAELGFEIDDAGLKKADALVKSTAEDVRALIAATGVLDTVHWGAEQARVALDAFEGLAGGFVEAQHAAEAALPSMQLDPALAAEADRLADATERLAKLRAQAAAQRADADASDVFNASAEGKALAAWKRQREAAEAAKKPVAGFADVVGRLHTSVTQVIGQKLPQSFHRLAQSMGVAKGDFATLGRMALGGLAGLTALAVGAVASSVGLAQQSEALREAAREARVTSSELQALQYAGAQSGVGVERMTRSITDFGQKLRDANNHLAGSGSTVYLLRRLGISARDASGQVRPTTDVLADLSVAMDRIGSPRRRIRVMDQLGLDRRMLDVLRAGEGGLRQYAARLEELGGGISPEATAASREFARAQEDLGRASDSLRSVLAVGVLPVLSWLSVKAAELGGWWARLTRGTHLVEVGMIGLGATAAAVALATIGVWGPVILPFVLFAAKVALLALAFDDLWTFIEGGDSAFGRWIDSMSHPGAALEVAERIRMAWQSAVDVIEEYMGWLARATGQVEAPSIGTLRAPRVDGRPNMVAGPGGRAAPNRRPSVRSAGAAVDGRPGAGGPIYQPGTGSPREALYTSAPQVVPWRAVTSPAAPRAGARGPTTIDRSTTVAAGAIVIHGATDPEAVARVVRRELAVAQAAQNDADHAESDDDPVGAGGVNEQ